MYTNLKINGGFIDTLEFQEENNQRVLKYGVAV